MKKILLFPFVVLAFFIGKVTWVSPPWFQAFFKVIHRYIKSSLVLLVLACAGCAGYFYDSSLPGPVMVTAEFDGIHLTPNYANAKPRPLDLRFEYNFSKLKANQNRPQGKPSVARIDLVGQEIVSGVTILPAKKGTWRWTDDRSMRFVPATDWPAGVKYSVKFDSSIFVKEALLSEDTYTLTAPKMTVSFSNTKFYQDPQDMSVRRVITTLNFSHPVDKSSLEKHLKLSMRPSGKNISVPPKPYTFSVTYDKQHREAYIQSEPVSLPDKPNYMTVTLPQGVKTVLGGKKIAKDSDTKVFIPDVYSFLKVNSRAQIVRNAQNEPEQMILLDFTDDINDKELLGKLAVYLLPMQGELNGRKHWKSPREVNANILAASQKVDFSVLPNEKTYSKLYSLKLDVPENRGLYIKINKGLKSINQFIHAPLYDNVVKSPRYLKEVSISGEGSVLTFSGNHKLGVLTRGVSAIKYKIGRLLKGQLYHLISQTSGDITNPNFNNWSFDEENIANFKTKILRLQKGHPQKANYSSIDLTRYLHKTKNRFGLFFVEVNGYDPIRKRELYSAESQDKRLILVTDLGVIVKDNANNTHDIFVQSIATGKPVSQAEVELLGKNGVPVFSGKTNAQGRVSVPTTRRMRKERTPTVYVVKSVGDLSFIPFDRRSRQINLSKYDIGGVRSSQFSKDSLNAFLFSDRGIYRPGETINIGLIVKNFDLSNVENIPLELVVRGPRNKELKVSKFKLPKMGFSDFQYPTEASSNTGRYHVSLHLVRDNRHRGREIGSTRFKVEEFQPDTLRIESKLMETVEQGWNTQETIKTQITLANLFGTPAQDRKITARLKIQPHNFRFKAYADYQFTHPYFNKERQSLSLNTLLGNKRTDADGLAEFELDLSKFKQGTYSLRFTAEGFEQAGGRSVMATNHTLISPLDTLVGYKADGKLAYINANSQRAIEFIAIDKTLKKKPLSGLTLKLKEIQRVSTLVKQRNGTYKYQTIKKEAEISNQALSLSEKGFLYAIDTATPGDFSLEVYDAEKRRLSRVTFSVVGFANLAGKIDKNAELQLKLNKTDYKPGERIKMHIKAPYHGAGLITIETDKVHNHKWFKTSAESTVQEITVPKNLEGTGYVNVAFVRDVSSKEIFTSPLSYAVVPFSIDKSKRRVDVTLKTQEIVRPGKPMDIAFSTSKPSRIAVFAVDEGILQVANYTTPAPLSHFLKKRALGVETLQILDLILPDFNIVKELSASGGGSSRKKSLANNLNPFSRKTDSPAVFWSGIHDADANIKHITFNVPDTFSGELRVMAVAVGAEVVGTAHTSSVVRGPFVLSPNVLTQAAPGDEFMVTVGVANIIEGSGKGAEIDLTVQSSEHLEIMGESQVKLSIDEGGEGKFTVKVKAKPKLGAAELRFTAKHKGDESTRTASLSVRPATTYYTHFDTGFASGGDVKLDGLRHLYPDLAEQSVAASSSPLVVVDGLQSYLKTFPHGCTEQVVSKVFPLVGLMSHPQYGPHVQEVKQHFSHLIDKLRERQLGDGGFAFWPGHTRSATYPSIYVMHFLLEAHDQGYPVPADMMQRGKDYLKAYIARRGDSLSASRDRANAIYLLTRLGEVTTNYLVDLEENLLKNHAHKWSSDILSTYMAATYQILQKDQEAKRLMRGYRLNASHQELNDFRSVLAMDAQYIYLLAKHFENKAKNMDADQILKLTDRIFRGEYNTISSAYSILALGAYSKLVLANDFDEKISFNGISSNEQKKLLTAALTPFLKASYTTNFEAIEIKGQGPLFYLNVQSGFNQELPTKSVREGIEIYRVFVDDKGNEVTQFEQGKELTVKLKIRALDGKSLSNIAVIDLLPGGFEVIRSSVSRTAYNWRADYVDVREDRVVYYGDFDGRLKELTYKVKLTAAGNFVIPPSYAESMYDRSIRAISPAGSFKVVASQ
jgi:alpha-2-macroglobulin